MAVLTHGADVLWVSFMGFGKGGLYTSAKLTGKRSSYLVINFSIIIALSSNEIPN
jgi:hypothetical protein